MDLRPLDLRHLRYFQAVAETGHMTRAAALLGIQQPPLSQQIKALEQQVGMPLFHRHPKGVTLTDGGRALLIESRRLLLDVAAMQRRIQAVADGKAGVLAVGFTSSAAAHRFTPEVLRRAGARCRSTSCRPSPSSWCDVPARRGCMRTCSTCAGSTASRRGWRTRSTA
jgi:DNA-binding transcriptional LysR family regulator